jgi:hypothetical protein
MEEFADDPDRLLGVDGRGRRAHLERTGIVYLTTRNGRPRARDRPANIGGTEAINGIIELHRRIARGFGNPTNYRLRMILAAGRITHLR